MNVNDILSKDNSVNNSRASSTGRKSRRLTTMAEIKVRKITDGLMPNNIKLPQEMKGFLFKYSPSMWAGWQKRYIVLKDRKLKYYKSDSPQHMEVPLGVINFDHFRCFCQTKSDDKDLVFEIEIDGVERR